MTGRMPTPPLVFDSPSAAQRPRTLASVSHESHDRMIRPKKHLPFNIAMFIALNMLSVVAAYGQETPPEDTPKETAEVSVNDIVEDDKISGRLSKIFESTEWFKNVSVDSDNGVVTITGNADTDDHRMWAENLTRRTEDVVATINKLEVEKAVDLEKSADAITVSLSTMWQDFLGRSPLIIASLVVLLLTWLVSKLVGRFLYFALQKRKIRGGLKDLFYQLATIGVWVAGFLFAAVVAFPGMTPTKALSFLGLGTVAIGFAFKDIFENFFAGILILWGYPFDRGDVIKCGDDKGVVQEITIRNTMIRALSGELIVVPNAQLFKTSVEVLTNQKRRRAQLVCGVAYGEDVNQSRDIIQAAVENCDTVDQQKKVDVCASEFADSSINFEVLWWTGSRPKEMRDSKDQVVEAIKSALDKADIEIPFPYRTLTFGDNELNELKQSIND